MPASVEAYHHLEQNLSTQGIVRGTNQEGRVQHFSWRKPVRDGITLVVDLLSDTD